MPKLLQDRLERLAWTVLEVTGGVITAANTDVPAGGEDLQTLIWTALFAILKLVLARYVGDKDSAAIAPVSAGKHASD